MSRKSTLIVGARSDIARATAHAFAAKGYDILMAARDVDRLAPDQADIALRYSVNVTLHECDILVTDRHAAFLDELPRLPDIVVSAVGVLGDQAESQSSAAAAITVMRSNFEGPALFLGEVANRMEARGNGAIVGISSVAGERGRASNYVYGSAKAGFTAFLSGLRNRLAAGKVRVVTVLPGFVTTAMTAHMDLPSRLTTQPEKVAKRILAALENGQDVIYVKRIWWLVMVIICAIPETIFKKLKL